MKKQQINARAVNLTVQTDLESRLPTDLETSNASVASNSGHTGGIQEELEFLDRIYVLLGNENFNMNERMDDVMRMISQRLQAKEMALWNL